MTARLHDWKPVDPPGVAIGGPVTHRCEHCGSTYPSGSAVFPCPGPKSRERAS